MFILAYDGLSITPDLKEFFRRFRIGGVILFKDNFESKAHLAETTAGLQRDCTDGTPLFVTTDHEGGRVQRFKDGFAAIAPMAQFGQGNTDATQTMARRAGRELRACGVNFNFAPVADICPPDRPGAIGDRSFSDDPGIVAAHVAAAVRGYREGGVASCAKHFPGHGGTEIDSHRTLPRIDRTLADMEAVELLPFRAAIAAGVDAIMTAHAVYPRSGEAELPASLSRYWMTDVLRKQLSFDGLLVSDAIEMDGVRQRWTPTEAGALAITGGADLLIYYRIEEQLKAVHALRNAFEDGEFDPAAVAHSLTRIAAAKDRAQRQDHDA